jgi:photosynthetic reaction center cytochrome c subunit
MSKSKTNTRSFLRLCLVTLFLCVAVVLVRSPQIRGFAKTSEPGVPSPPTQKNSGADVKLVEQVYKNIQVFKGMPASELEPTMAFISGSLGVKCSFCHVNPFDKDDRPTKQTARRMIRMVFDLNKGSFNGDKAVSCFTCHRGRPQPISVPAVGQNLWQPGPASEKENPLPSADQILDKYVQAIGGEQAFNKLTSRVAKGSRIGADGVLVPEDVYQKAPNKILTVVTYPKVVFSTGFNGIAGWGSSSQDGVRDLPPPVLAQLKTDAEFYKEIKMKELYRKLNVVGRSTIADSEVYVVDATPKDAPSTGRPEKLYFDARSGLLVRRYLESETMMGMFPLQTDYSDYREVDGIKQPFLIRWSMPGRSWGRQIAEIKQNVTLGDAQFNAPLAKP